jgi:hypothetical protein
MPAASSGRNRAPGSGGLWDDDARPRRRRPDASDPRAAGLGARTAIRDPRALRRGLVNENAELPDENSGFTAGKAVLVIFLMFVIGVGAGYGYFRFSQPTVHGDTPASSTTTPTFTPSASPSASPKATASPHALAPSGGGPNVLVAATI